VVSTILWHSIADSVPGRLNCFPASSSSSSSSSERESRTIHLLVANSLLASCVYENVLRDGLSRELVLPRSEKFDCVLCACVGDFDMDGRNEVGNISSS
jgi:hypothetical protein